MPINSSLNSFFFFKCNGVLKILIQTFGENSEHLRLLVFSYIKKIKLILLKNLHFSLIFFLDAFKIPKNFRF